MPPDSPRSAEVVYMLAKKSIHRGRELGFPLLRFDVTDEPMLVVDNELKNISNIYYIDCWLYYCFDPKIDSAVNA